MVNQIDINVKRVIDIGMLSDTLVGKEVYRLSNQYGVEICSSLKTKIITVSVTWSDMEGKICYCFDIFLYVINESLQPFFRCHLLLTLGTSLHSN